MVVNVVFVPIGEVTRSKYFPIQLGWRYFSTQHVMSFVGARCGYLYENVPGNLVLV